MCHRACHAATPEMCACEYGEFHAASYNAAWLYPRMRTGRILRIWPDHILDTDAARPYILRLRSNIRPGYDKDG